MIPGVGDVEDLYSVDRLWLLLLGTPYPSVPLRPQSTAPSVYFFYKILLRTLVSEQFTRPIQFTIMWTLNGRLTNLLKPWNCHTIYNLTPVFVLILPLSLSLLSYTWVGHETILQNDISVSLYTIDLTLPKFSPQTIQNKRSNHYTVAQVTILERSSLSFWLTSVLSPLKIPVQKLTHLYHGVCLTLSGPHLRVCQGYTAVPLPTPYPTPTSFRPCKPHPRTLSGGDGRRPKSDSTLLFSRWYTLNLLTKSMNSSLLNSTNRSSHRIRFQTVPDPIVARATKSLFGQTKEVSVYYCTGKTVGQWFFFSSPTLSLINFTTYLRYRQLFSSLLNSPTPCVPVPQPSGPPRPDYPPPRTPAPTHDLPPGREWKTIQSSSTHRHRKNILTRNPS